MREYKMRFIAVAIMAMALSGCQPTPALKVTDAWVRLPAVTGQAGVAYFTLHGGPTDDRLLSVSADYAIRSSIHESMNAGGMMAMKPIETGIVIPAGAVVEFKPGGLHVMLEDIRPGLAPPERMPMTFTFASGVQVRTNAPLSRPGDK
jgi:periplasmic copper chaperone A